MLPVQYATRRQFCSYWCQSELEQHIKPFSLRIQEACQQQDTTVSAGVVANWLHCVYKRCSHAVRPAPVPHVNKIQDAISQWLLSFPLLLVASDAREVPVFGDSAITTA